jgi:hypothetical protein
MNLKRVLWIVAGVALVACIGSLWWQTRCEPPRTLPEGYHVLISSCRDAEVIDISPNGEYLLVDAWEPKPEVILVNLRTNETIVIPNTVLVWGFLDDNTVIMSGDKFWLIKEQEMITLSKVHVEDTPQWAQQLIGREALIFPFLNDIYGFVPGVSISRDPPIVIKFNNQMSLPETTAILETGQIPYVILGRITGSTKTKCFESECNSHNGQFELSNNQILAADGTVINPAYEEIEELVGWSFDDRRVYGDAFEKQTNTGFLFASRQLHPSGVIYYEIPEEYFYP